MLKGAGAYQGDSHMLALHVEENDPQAWITVVSFLYHPEMNWVRTVTEQPFVPSAGKTHSCLCDAYLTRMIFIEHIMDLCLRKSFGTTFF